ncbi:MAG: hypothetical protein KDA22_01760, partial [Phycisphaerales bacterium]|nr:hypothetical protein [Phycisphaerales bacterium]
VPRERVADPPRRILLSALLWSVVVIMPFSFAAGKRADYIVPAYPTMALIAAWWVLDRSPWPRLWRLAVAVAAGAIAVMAVVNWIGTDQRRSTIDAMNGVAARLLEERERPHAPPLVVVDPLFMTQLSSMATTGRPADSSETSILNAIDRGEPLRIGYTREHASPAFVARLDQLEAAGRLHERWRVPLQWEHDKKVVDLEFVFDEVAGTR